MSGKLDETQIEAIARLREVYPHATIALIGAAALNMHLEVKWRTTADLDFVITIPVADLEPTLEGRPGWAKASVNEHRWRAPNGVLVDIVPAPPPALDRRELTWPRGQRMSLVGIRLALEEPLFEVAPGLSIRVASVPVLAVLKMAAYLDRPSERAKDLRDIGHILDEYPTAGDERFYDEDAFDTEFDERELRGFILGREIAKRADATERELVESFTHAVWASDSTAFLRDGPWSWRVDELQRVVAAFLRGLAAR